MKCDDESPLDSAIWIKTKKKHLKAGEEEKEKAGGKR